jgi:polyisoprenoid-binding protein YceI
MSRNRMIALALVAIVAIGAGAYLAYDNVLRGDDVAPLALPSASPAAVASDSTDPSTSAEPTASVSTGAGSTTDPGADTDGDVAGTWTVTGGSEAGYRVREQLANLPAESDAIGRTNDISGSITIVAAGDGAQLTAGTLEIDTTTIASDEDRRDNRMRSEGLQTDQFPTASFTVTTPIDIPAAALAGTATDVTLVGDLTLHGVTKSVEIPAQAQLADGQIQVAGSLPIVLADYDIVAPNVGGFIVSIDDEGALEFLVVFSKG